MGGIPELVRDGEAGLTFEPGNVEDLREKIDKQHLSHHPLRGALFESFVISDLLKRRFNQGEGSNLYFWRDKLGHEIDCLLEQPDGPVLVEIKSGKTVADDFFEHLEYYQNFPESHHGILSLFTEAIRSKARRGAGHPMELFEGRSLEAQ